MTASAAISEQYDRITRALDDRDAKTLQSIVTDAAWMSATLARFDAFASLDSEIQIISVTLRGDKAEVRAHYSLDGVPKTAPGGKVEVAHTAQDVVDLWALNGATWRLIQEQPVQETRIVN
jgi:hypothetical protein